MDVIIALPIMFLAGAMFGYSVGFLISRSIYRSKQWPMS